MAEDPRVIRQRIERTRDEMDGTLDALADKADVSSRAKGYLARKKDAVVGVARGATSNVADAAPETEDVRHTTRRAVAMVKENPVGVAVGAAAAGFIVGLVIPSTRKEDETLGPAADRVKDSAKELGQEAVEHGKDIGQQVTDSAVRTARQAVGEHGEQLKESAQDKAEDVSSDAAAAG